MPKKFPDPCPFCGSNTDGLSVVRADQITRGMIYTFDNVINKVFVRCCCGAMGPAANTQREAVDSWNSRSALSKGESHDDN